MRIFAARYICSREYFPSEQTSGMLCRAMAVRLACVWHVCGNLMGFRGTIFCSAICLVRRIQLRTDLPPTINIFPYTLYLIPYTLCQFYVLQFGIIAYIRTSYVRTCVNLMYTRTYVRMYVFVSAAT